MEVLYPCCCGLDVHKRFVVACLACLITRDEAGQVHKALQRFSTLTPDILRLCDWLHAAGCTHIALASTGVYWKPLFNLMEGLFQIVLVNAQHMQAVPGRKTDTKMRSGSLTCCSMVCSKPRSSRPSAPNRNATCAT